MSLPSSLISSLESVLSPSAKSLANAEDAVVQAKGALEAAKKALEMLNHSEEKPESSHVEQVPVNVQLGTVEIVDVESSDDIQYSREELLALQSVPLSRKKPDNLPQLSIVKDLPHHLTFTALASSEPAINTSFLKKNYVRSIGNGTVGRIVKYCGGNDK